MFEYLNLWLQWLFFLVLIIHGVRGDNSPMTFQLSSAFTNNCKQEEETQGNSVSKQLPPSLNPMLEVALFMRILLPWQPCMKKTTKISCVNDNCKPVKGSSSNELNALF